RHCLSFPQGGRRLLPGESRVWEAALKVIRILHLADLHLGWEPPWSEIASERRLERDQRLGRAVDWALENEIDVVLIVGDLFETHRPPAGLVREVIAQLARLVAHGV